MTTIMSEYVDDELPLPKFSEVFGEGNMSSKKLRRMDMSDGLGSNGEETTGRWTPEEHRLFLEGIMLYGKDWKKMQPLIKTRTLVQIRTHAQKVFKKIGLKKINSKAKPQQKQQQQQQSGGVRVGIVSGNGEAMVNGFGSGASGNGIVQQHFQQQQQQHQMFSPDSAAGASCSPSPAVIGSAAGGGGGGGEIDNAVSGGSGSGSGRMNLDDAAEEYQRQLIYYDQQMQMQQRVQLLNQQRQLEIQQQQEQDQDQQSQPQSRHMLENSGSHNITSNSASRALFGSNVGMSEEGFSFAGQEQQQQRSHQQQLEATKNAEDLIGLAGNTSGSGKYTAVGDSNNDRGDDNITNLTTSNNNDKDDNNNDKDLTSGKIAFSPATSAAAASSRTAGLDMLSQASSSMSMRNNNNNNVGHNINIVNNSSSATPSPSPAPGDSQQQYGGVDINWAELQQQHQHEMDHRQQQQQQQQRQNSSSPPTRDGSSGALLVNTSSHQTDDETYTPVHVNVAVTAENTAGGILDDIALN